MDFIRLFTAVRPPAEMLTVLDGVQSRLRDALDGPAVRWVGTENMHVTLQFLGDTADNRVRDVVEAISEGVTAVGPRQSLELEVTHLGGFPTSRRPRVVWIGIRDTTEQLPRLQEEISSRLRGRGFPLDPRPFRPHITLGYVRRRATREAIRTISAAITDGGRGPTSAASHSAERILLVQSTLTQSGAVYRDLHSVPLSAASNNTSSGASARE